LSEALELALDWYKSSLEGANMRQKSLEQIAQYARLSAFDSPAQALSKGSE
jgi:hypothetical protein